MQAARAAYSKDDQVYAAFGLQPGDYDDAFEVWPDNWRAWSLYVELSGQWRVGFGGRYALDYVALFARMERLRLADAEWEALFADVRVIERATLEEMAKADR